MTEEMKKEIKEHLKEENQAWGLGLLKTLEKENEELKNQIAGLQNNLDGQKARKNHHIKENAHLTSEVAELKVQIEKMKCCGNCKNYQIYNADKGIRECWFYYANEKRCTEKYEKWELAK